MSQAAKPAVTDKQKLCIAAGSGGRNRSKRPKSLEILRAI
jgi:hypothetical protein